MTTETLPVTTSIEMAVKLQALLNRKADIEAEIDQYKAEIVQRFPEVLKGVSPPGLKVVLTERVKMLDEAKAAAYYQKHVDHRAMFKLTVTKDNYILMGRPTWATLNKSSPTIQADVKYLAKVRMEPVDDSGLAA